METNNPAWVKCRTFSMSAAGQTLYRTLSLHKYGGGNIYLDRDMNKPRSSDPFPKGTGCTPWFFRMSAGTKLNYAFHNSSPNNNFKENKGKKNLNFVFFKGSISTRGISAISTINAPKWRQSTETWTFSSNATFLSTEAPLD